METRKSRIVVAFVGVALAAGCVTTLSPQVMLPSSPVSGVRRTERTITVAPVTSEGRANAVALDVTEKYGIGTVEFQAALAKALVTSGLFRSVVSAGGGDYELRAHIVSQQSQRTGFMTISSFLVVNYRLRETAGDRDLWHDTIISEGVPGLAKESLAGAARQNITEMLEKVSGTIQ